MTLPKCLPGEVSDTYHKSHGDRKNRVENSDHGDRFEAMRMITLAEIELLVSVIIFKRQDYQWYGLRIGILHNLLRSVGKGGLEKI